MTDIAGERRRLAAQGLAIIEREQWGARESYGSDRHCDMPARQLFLHISVTALRSSETTGVREVEAIGESRFGIGMSYNAVAFPSGRLYEGQPLTRRGAHTINNFEAMTCREHGGSLAAPSWNLNVTARALVLPQMVGDPVTDRQIDSAARWAAAQVRSGLAVRGVRWHGHRCVTAKECPGGKAFARIDELQRLTEHYVAAGLGDDDMPTAQEIVTELLKREVPTYLPDGKGGHQTRTIGHLLGQAAEIHAIAQVVCGDVPSWLPQDGAEFDAAGRATSRGEVAFRDALGMTRTDSYQGATSGRQAVALLQHLVELAEAGQGPGDTAPAK